MIAIAAMVKSGIIRLIGTKSIASFQKSCMHDAGRSFNGILFLKF